MDDAKEKVDLSRQMEVIMRGILKIMLQMAMGFMLVRKDLDIKDNGKIMCPMVLGRPVIQMVPDMLVNF